MSTLHFQIWRLFFRILVYRIEIQEQMDATDNRIIHNFSGGEFMLSNYAILKRKNLRFQ